MSNETNLCTIISRKFDGSIHRQWKAEKTEQSNNLIIFLGEFEKEVKHNELGVIRRGTISYEYYWLDRGYNVFRFHEPDGDLRNYYCNLNQPPTFVENVLDYVDLDLDVLVRKDFSIEILDLEEYEYNAKKFKYSKSLIDEVDKNLSQLLALIENRDFPFDFKV
jgi:protein associated with RNAse G/E